MRSYSTIKGFLFGLIMVLIIIEISTFFVRRELLLFGGVRIRDVHDTSEVYWHPEKEPPTFNIEYPAKELVAIEHWLPSDVLQESSEWDMMINLRKWARGLQPDDVFLTVGFSDGEVTAASMLHQLDNDPSFVCLCGDLARIYVTALQHLDIPARSVQLFRGSVVNLSPPGYPNTDTHITVEVWSKKHQKWVIMDPTFNAYFTIDGVPASVLDMHNFARTGHGHFEVIRDGATSEPTLESYYIDPLLLYQNIIYPVAIDDRYYNLSNRLYRNMPYFGLFAPAEYYYIGSNIPNPYIVYDFLAQAYFVIIPTIILALGGVLILVVYFEARAKKYSRSIAKNFPVTAILNRDKVK